MSDTRPAPANKGFCRKFPKAMSAVDDARLAVLDFLEPLALQDKVVNRLEVVLEELVTNVVRHADEATHVQVSASPSKEGLCLCVEDDGAAFNPLEHDGHTPFETLDDAQIGGLGIPLIKRLSQSVEYARVGDANQIRAVIAA